MFEKLTHQFPVQKTLRFALRPVGKTSEHITNNDLLRKDEELAEKYKQAKKIIDEYHKHFITDCLSTIELDAIDLESLYEAYSLLKKDRNDKNVQGVYNKLQKKLRQTISKSFETERIFSKDFIKSYLPTWLQCNEVEIEGISDPQDIIENFKNWTTYFTGFNKNRKNMYTSEPHSTAIAYRLVHENLPRFMDNIDRYKEAKEQGLTEDFLQLGKDFAVDLDIVFSLKYFNSCLTQHGIELYNRYRGGQGKANNEKQQGINEKINLYAQSLEEKKANAVDEEKRELELKRKRVRACTLEDLYKQILSDREQQSFRVQEITSDAQLIRNIKNSFQVEGRQFFGFREQVHAETGEIQWQKHNIFENLHTAIKNLNQADQTQLYIKNDTNLTAISQQLFGDWAIIKKSLENYAEHQELGKNKEGTAKKFTKSERERWLKSTYFTFTDIHKALQHYFEQFAEDELDTESEGGISQASKAIALKQPLIQYFASLLVTKPKSTEEPAVDLTEAIIQSHEQLVGLFTEYADENKEKLKAKPKKIAAIKAYLDTIVALLHAVKPLSVRLSAKEQKDTESYSKDSSFYSQFDDVYESLQQIIRLYNQVRNYLTKKPFNVEKYKLNFENNTLAHGWDRNKETDNSCIIFLKDEKYFLGITSSKHKKIFEGDLPQDPNNNFQKMQYKLLPGARMLSKVFFGAKNIDYYNPTQKLLDIRNYASHTKRGLPQKGYQKKDFSSQDMHEMIDFFKSSISIHPDWKKFGFQFSDTERYEDLSSFYREFEHQGYTINFQKIATTYIDRCVNEGKLYLFEIYSKDFSSASKGKPNLQTLYWKELFSDRNLKDVVYKLNGEAEIFFRRASLKYSDEKWVKGHHANDPQKKQPYPIIKDNRYARDTYLFHVSISCNFKANGVLRFNDTVNSFLKDNPDVKILGIDRGERHLAYYTMIDQKGNIVKDSSGKHIQGSLNSPLEVDYQLLLDTREKEREGARKSWGNIEKIKDLKQGYLSQVVHKLCKLVIEHNAIIVFEDLNFGFKRGRFKVEKQVYQKLEKALIDKLNYLVFKETSAEKPGGVLKALQLTQPFTSFKDMGKQTGIIFYVPAYHTSKVCPATGFVNLLYPRYETIRKAQDFLKKFDNIAYNQANDFFSFSFDYTKFTGKIKDCKPKWTVCSNGARLENFRNPENNNQWDTREIQLSNRLEQLFKKYSIEYRKEENLIPAIVVQTDKSFFKEILYLLRLTLQMRNSRTGTDEDWMVSPVVDEHGTFFDSRKADGNLPQNADANGAYHIALKGLWNLGEINKTPEEKQPNLKISNADWYKFIQEKPYKKR